MWAKLPQREIKKESSIYKGVKWSKGGKSWGAHMKVNGRDIHLGCFWDEEVAAQITRIFRTKHHGEFANHG